MSFIGESKPNPRDYLQKLDQMNPEEASKELKNPLFYQTIVDSGELLGHHLQSLIYLSRTIIDCKQINNEINRIITIANEKGVIDNEHLLHQAIKKNNNELVVALINKGCHLNVLDEEGNSPFAIASSLGNEEVICQLLEKGADVDLVSGPALNEEALQLKQKMFESSHRLYELFFRLPAFSGIEGKSSSVYRIFYRAWADPNYLRYNVSRQQFDKIFEILKNNPGIAKFLPNLCTTLICESFAQGISIEKMISCLKANPQLLEGPRVNEFVKMGIKSGKLPLIRELVEAFHLPLDGTYTDTIGFDRYEGLTPFHHALSQGSLDIAQWMLDKGISIDAQDGKGRTALQFFVGNSKVRDHSVLLWLIEHGADVETKDEKGSSLLSLMTEKIEWPLLIDLLEKGVKLTQQQAQHFFTMAIQSGQRVAVHLLLTCFEKEKESISLEKIISAMDQQTLNALVQNPHEGWVKKTITYLLDHGLSINKFESLEGHSRTLFRKKEHLLDQLISKKRYSLAAFLISQGLSIPQSSSHSAKLSLVQKQAEYLKIGSHLEKTLRAHISLANIGNLVGDSFLKKMVDIQGGELEGNVVSHSIEFFHRALLFILDKHSELFSQKQREEIELLLNELDTALLLAKGIEDSSSSQAQTALQQLSKSIKDKLLAAKEGETVVIPYGWQAEKGGHAMLISCRKVSQDQFIFHVINTGSGLDYHLTQHDAAKMHLNTSNAYLIPSAVIEEGILLRQILEPSLLGKTVKLETDRKYQAEDLYANLQPYQLSQKQAKEQGIDLDETWMHMQLSGTCSMRSLLALLASRIGMKEYKKIKPLLKEEILKMGLEQNIGLIQEDPALIKLFSFSIPKLFGSVYKQLERETVSAITAQKKVEQLESLKSQLDQEVPPRVSTNRPISGIHTLAAETSNLQEMLQKLGHTEISKVAEKIAEAPQTYPQLPEIYFSSIKNGDQLLEALKAYNVFAKGRIEEEGIGLFLRQLGTEFCDENSHLLNDLNEKPDVCMPILVELRALASEYFYKNVEKEDFSGIGRITLSHALAVGWQICKMMDSSYPENAGLRISDYGLSVNHLYPFKRSLINSVISPELEKDYRELDRFFKKEEMEKNLFDFAEQGVVHHELEGRPYITLKMNSADYHYAQAHSMLRPNEFWKKADTSLELMLQKFPDQDRIPNEHWRTFWCYAKQGLPEHFLILRELSVMAQLNWPRGHPQKWESSKIEVFGPSLIPDPSQPKKKLIVTFSWDREKVDLAAMDKQEAVVGPISKALHEPLYKKQKLEEISLPKEKGSLKLAPERNDKAPYSFPYVISSTQNAIITQTQSGLHNLLKARTPLSKDSGLSLSLLIDYFSSHLIELTRLESRVFFASTLNNLNTLQEGIAEPDRASDLIDFFSKSIDHFQFQIAQNENVKESLQALLFLLEQKQRVLQAVKQAGFTPLKAEEELDEMRDLLEEMKKRPECSSLFDQQYLNLILLDTYHAVDIGQLRPMDIHRMMEASCDLAMEIVKSEKNPQLFHAFREQASLSVIKHQRQIHDFLQASPGVLQESLNALLLRDDPTFKGDGVWIEASFPLYQCKLADSIFEINILKGTLTKNGNSFASMHEIRGTNLYKEVFGEQALVGFQNKNWVESADAGGKIRFYPHEKKVHREIDGAWCVFSNSCANFRISQTFKFPQLPDEDQLQVWQVIGKKELVIFDKKTKQPKYLLDEKGYFHFPVDDKKRRYEWVNLSDFDEGKALTNFAPHAILWKPAPLLEGDSYPPLLVCPHYKDERNNQLQFEMREENWHLSSAPHLKISSEQTLEISRFNRFLILKNPSGEKEALILKNTPLDALDKDYYSTWFSADCERVKLEGGMPQTKSSRLNAYLAYLYLGHANTPEDYSQAMQFLKKAYKFERYTEEELKIFGWIFTLYAQKKDRSGPMDAFRLYTAWLVQDNLKRNPVSGLPKVSLEGKNINFPAMDAPPSHWAAFWNNEWKWVKKGKPRILISEIHLLNQHYLARRETVKHDCRLENILDPQELIEWGFERRSKQFRQLKHPDRLDIKRDYRLNAFVFLSKSYASTPLAFHTRPGKQFSEHFPLLYSLARSSNPKDRQKVKTILSGMHQDPYPGNAGMQAFLYAALLLTEGTGQEKGYKEALELIERLEADWKGTDLKQMNSKLGDFVESYEFFPKTDETEVKERVVPIVEILPPSQPHALPSVMPSIERMHFVPEEGKLTNLQGLYREHFVEVQKEKEDIQPFIPFTTSDTDEFMRTSIDEFNQDSLRGREKNLGMASHELKEGMQISERVSTLKAQLEKIKIEDEARLKELQKMMSSLLHKLPLTPEEQVKDRAALLAGKKAPLTEQDGIALFLLGDFKEFKKSIPQLSDLEVNTLYQAIGNVLLLSRKIGHVKSILNIVGELEREKVEEEIPSLIQKLGIELSTEQYSVTEKDIPAEALPVFIVLEHGLKLYMKQDRVEGLRDMLKQLQDVDCPNLFFQRIQGGGKTLIFGHTMALLKADGYHLSIHVVPTPQYGTALYDMQHVSGRVFGQKECTLVFDDHPDRFTIEYLTWMKNSLMTAIVNREYITLTNETLRALRCKYIKTRFQIRDKLAHQGETSEVKQLEEKNAILKEVLSIMRKRGIFTFDEMHEAKNPKKELIMPYGEVSHVVASEARAMAKTFLFTANAKEEDETPLLNLAENKQSQQTEAQYAKMEGQILDQLMEDTEFNQHLVLFELNNEERKEVRQFLSGKAANIPSKISQKVDEAKTNPNDPFYQKLKNAADVIVLTRQLLAGRWMIDRLQNSVNEHFGLSNKEEFAGAAIPFSANMKPTENSEFSDQYVMMLNTLIAYAVQGLSVNQMKHLVDDFRGQAFQEQMAKEEQIPSLKLKETEAALKFSNVFEKDLFQINKDDPNEMADLQQKLLARTDASYDLLLDVVVRHVLPNVELYRKQISSHGQNTASMAYKFVGYSGSFDNLNLAPPGTKVQPELGTNGQTVDLILRQNNELHILVPKADSPATDVLFDEVIAHHPDKKNIRAIIDVGCLFRGIPNEDVAKRICKYLQDHSSSLKGVLYFNPSSGKLHFMSKEQTDRTVELSGTRPETIEIETGYTKDQLFTYYDQDHITGIDIAQARRTKAVLTVSEHTKIHEILQGGRRLRELDLNQRLIFACERGAMQKMAVKIQKRDEPLTVRDLILFAHLKEKEAQKDENLLLCLQKIENVLQQNILDRAYDLSTEEERKLFDCAAHLFVKTIAVDLFSEYAHQRENISIEEYLHAITDSLIEPLIALSGNEKQSLRKSIDAIIKEALPGLKDEIQVTRDFKKAPTQNATKNPDATMVQYRQQEKQTLQQTQRVQESQTVQEQMSETFRDMMQTHTAAQEVEGLWEILKDNTLVTPYSPASKCIGNERDAPPEIWALNEALSIGLFDPNFFVTSNFAISWKGRVDLLESFRKTPSHFLVIANAEGKRELLLCSVEEAVEFKKGLLNIRQRNPGRKIYLLRATEKLKPEAASDRDPLILDQEMKRLIVQAFFFSGDFQTLSKKDWNEFLDESLPKGELRKAYRSFFEDHILQGNLSDEYKASALYHTLQN